ncbi:AAA family ATPase [Desulfosediminicola flagellatus]|uniref:AAA family ATPase n=1 Tax=Desulfosediminicola flagellatus TaxID=2569541 RepID=UPI0010ACF0AB|nr:AAA family ATPase [Desulfosediminicola flagellatus]
MRTVIIGNSGSGKTWLSQKLATPNAQIIHLDALFWMPGGFDNKRDREEVNQLIFQSKEHLNWVAEGVFGELAEHYFDVAQTLIWLDMSWDLCCSRLEQRGSESKKHLGREQTEEGLRKLLDWASHYYDRTDTRSRKGHQSLYNLFQEEKILLKSELEVDEYLKSSQTRRCTRTGEL